MLPLEHYCLLARRPLYFIYPRITIGNSLVESSYLQFVIFNFYLVPFSSTICCSELTTS